MPGGGGGGAKAAGQEGGAGLAEQGDAADRLRRDGWSFAVSSWWPAGGALSWCSVKLTSVAAVLIKNKRLEWKHCDSVSCHSAH